MRRYWTIGATFCLLLIGSGCGGGGGIGIGSSDGGPVGSGLSAIGGVATKGPVSGASMTAFGMNANGTKGSQIGTTTTDAQGHFSMNVGNHAGSVMLQLTGGSFTDEATGTQMTMGSGDMMTALIPSMTAGEHVTNIQITPLTSMAQQMAQGMKGGMTEANITQANEAVGHYFSVSDILETQPMNPLANGTGAGATQDQRNYGMTMAAMSEYADMIGMPNSAGMVTAMMSDASDGHMDGMMGGHQITMGGGMMGSGMMGGNMMQPSAGTTGLADAMHTFIQSGQNRSGLTVHDMQALINQLATSDGTIR